MFCFSFAFACCFLSPHKYVSFRVGFRLVSFFLSNYEFLPGPHKTAYGIENLQKEKLSHTVRITTYRLLIRIPRLINTEGKKKVLHLLLVYWNMLHMETKYMNYFERFLVNSQVLAWPLNMNDAADIFFHLNQNPLIQIRKAILAV